MREHVVTIPPNLKTINVWVKCSSGKYQKVYMLVCVTCGETKLSGYCFICEANTKCEEK